MCLKKYFLHFGHPKTSFSPWEISQRLGRSKGSEKGWWCQVMSVVLLSLCLQFWSLLCVLWTTDEGDVFDHNYTKGIAKQNNEDSEDDWEVVDNNNLPPSCSLFYTSSYLIGWICVFWRKNTKVLQDIWCNFGYIFYTYFRIKNNNKNCAIIKILLQLGQNNCFSDTYYFRCYVFFEFFHSDLIKKQRITLE